MGPSPTAAPSAPFVQRPRFASVASISYRSGKTGPDSLIVSILVVSAAMTFRGAGQNMKPRFYARRWAEEPGMEMEAAHRRREQERKESSPRERGLCNSASYSNYPGG